MLISLQQIENGADLLSLQARVAALEAATNPTVEHISVPASATSANPLHTITLQGVPTAVPVELFINTGFFVEGVGAFTVNRAATPATITWTFTAAQGGFDIIHDDVDEVIVRYVAVPTE